MLSLALHRLDSRLMCPLVCDRACVLVIASLNIDQTAHDANTQSVGGKFFSAIPGTSILPNPFKSKPKPGSKDAEDGTSTALCTWILLMMILTLDAPLV